MERVAINAGDNEAEKTILNEGWKIEQEMTKFPEEEKEKVREAYRFTCYLEQIVKLARKWSEEEWAEARKSNVFNYKGVDFDVSEVGADFNHQSFFLAGHLSTQTRKGYLEDYRKLIVPDHRSSLWRDFVHKLRDPEDPETVAALDVNHRQAMAELSESLSEKVKSKKKKPSKKELEKARAYLETQKPNLKEYGPVLEKAEEGDQEAAALLDELAGVPARGWDSIRFFALEEGRIDREIAKVGGPRTHYPISQGFCNMLRMPKNAHPSYVEAGIEIAHQILMNPEEREESHKNAKKFLKKWQKPMKYKNKNYDIQPVREREAIKLFLEQYWDVEINSSDLEPLSKFIDDVLEEGIKIGFEHNTGNGFQRGLRDYYLSEIEEALLAKWDISAQPKGYAEFKQEYEGKEFREFPAPEEFDQLEYHGTPGFAGWRSILTVKGAFHPHFAHVMSKQGVFYSDMVKKLSREGYETTNDPTRTMILCIIEQGNYIVGKAFDKKEDKKKKTAKKP